MAFDKLQITEIFHSIQGESSLLGERFAFIRLTGCNLRCVYCDSTYAFKGGKALSTLDILEAIKPYKVRHALVTGGEPLIQRNTFELVTELGKNGYIVSIETHGEHPIEKYAPYARIIMDIKTPGSQMSRGGFTKNLEFLKPSDEIKFVITSEEDYFWAKKVVQDVLQNHPQAQKCLVLFSPIYLSHGPTLLKWIAEKILQDQLNVRLQTQFHKLIWGANTKGV